MTRNVRKETVAVVDTAPSVDAARGASGVAASDADAAAAGGCAARGSGLIVWHIDTGADTSLARPCGAWWLGVGRTEEEGDGEPVAGPGAAATLVAGRPVLATDAARRGLTAAGIAPSGIVDAAATVRGFREEIRNLQEAFDRERTGGSLVAPSWPEVPDPPVGPGMPDVTASDDEDRGATATALMWARWLADLADRWQSMEGQRLQRKFLRGYGGQERRPLRLVCG